MSLYLKYFKIHFMSQMEYKTSFILLSIGQFFVPFLTFISMYLLFDRFNNIAGWSLYEVALCYGVIHIGFSTSEFFARGLDSFSSLVRDGGFDRLLVRPRGTILQVLGSRVDFTRLGRLLQGILVLIYAINNLDMVWTPIKIFTIILMLISGVFVFTCIYMLGASMCFYTIQGIEVINIFTDGGREMAQYPLDIYKDFVKKFFTYIIPFGAINYYPLKFVLGKSNDSILNVFIPLYGILFIIPCILIWSYGVKHYKSTGS